MIQLRNLAQGTLFSNNLGLYSCPSSPLMLLRHKHCFYNRKYASFQRNRGNHFAIRGSWDVLDSAETVFLTYKDKDYKGVDLDAFPHIQTLGKFPKEELSRKVVMVRFDSSILLHEELDQNSPSVSNALWTIKYLHDAGAKIILISNWSVKKNSKFLEVESVVELLSAVLQLKVAPSSLQSKMEDKEKYDILLLENLSQFREEFANCSKFAELLSAGIDIFVNDAFSLSHRVLASTVGITRFCYASVAGFHFEEGMRQLKKVVGTDKKPFVAIIGGGKFVDKAAALYFLASRCDGLVFVGLMAFQIMHALGLPVPMSLIEHGAVEEASKITQLAMFRRIPVLFPTDFWCMNDCPPNQLELFPAQGILDGWLPFDIGPKSLERISSLLSEFEKILWIGPAKFSLSGQDINGATELAIMLDKLIQRNRDVTVVGNMACEAISRVSGCLSAHNMVANASVMWEILKGRKLPGLMALDRAYPYEIDWNATYADLARPLVVDIGSGNGLFLYGMARRQKDLNFLGLEINEKLVNRCLASVRRSGMENLYFIATNATTTFRSIVSSYPGELILVTVQCPNPDFNKPEYRWSMLQRSLVEAITDLLTSDGKVFLQSDIEAVAVRMKQQFLQYGKGKLNIKQDDDDDDDDALIGQGGWLKENPFGVRSDWEQHVIDRGVPMYRLMLFKSINNASEVS